MPTTNETPHMFCVHPDGAPDVDPCPCHPRTGRHVAARSEGLVSSRFFCACGHAMSGGRS